MGKQTETNIEREDTPCIKSTNNNNSLDIKPGNSVTKAKIQKSTPDNGTKLGSANSSAEFVQIANNDGGENNG